MSTHLEISSIAPHDFYLGLNVDAYFDHEHDPERIFEEGFTRPLPLQERDILVTIHFNGDPDHPVFNITTPADLSSEERQQAQNRLSRILGTEIDLRPFYEQVENDPVFNPITTELYGLKRISRANLFEDTINRIVQMRLSHKPTARRMVFDLRKKYGTALLHEGEAIPAWPRPAQLATADPMQIHELGPTRKKSEYIVEFARRLVSGELELDKLEKCDPADFYEKMTDVKGIGPVSAQHLMLFRNRTDAYLPSNKVSGREKSVRRWICYHYGENPDTISETDFQDLIRHWRGYEAAAVEFLYVDWIMRKKRE